MLYLFIILMPFAFSFLFYSYQVYKYQRLLPDMIALDSSSSQIASNPKYQNIKSVRHLNIHFKINGIEYHYCRNPSGSNCRNLSYTVRENKVKIYVDDDFQLPRVRINEEKCSYFQALKIIKFMMPALIFCKKLNKDLLVLRYQDRQEKMKKQALRENEVKNKLKHQVDQVLLKPIMKAKTSEQLAEFLVSDDKTEREVAKLQSNKFKN